MEMENKKGYVLINLLPYRERLKKEGIQKFGILMGLFVALSGAVILSGHTYLSLKIDSQNTKNAFIQKENKALDGQIKEIATLRDEIKETLAKRQVVERLQVNRADGVNVMNEVSIRMPEGLVVKSINKVGEKVTIVGETQSNAKVAEYMTALDSSEVFELPQLIEVKSITARKAPGRNAPRGVAVEEINSNEFSLTVNMERKVEVEEVKKPVANTPAARAAAAKANATPAAKKDEAASK